MMVLALTIKATLLMAAGLLVLALLRNSNARQRSVLMLAILLGSLLLPFAEHVGPRWHFAYWPGFLSSGSEPIHADSLSGSILLADVAVEADEIGLSMVPLAGLHAIDWSWWIALVWMIGVSVLTIRHGIALWRARTLILNSRRVEDAAWLRSLRHAQMRTGVQRPAGLHISSGISVPVTTGLFRVSICLPKDCGNWSAARREVVLAHELMHIARRDWLWQLLVRCVTTLYWLSPLSWVLARRYAVQCEHACDEAVLAIGIDPVVYASELVAIAKMCSGKERAAMAALSMATRSGLEHRLLGIHGFLTRKGRSRSTPRMGLLLLGLSSFPIYAVAPAASDTVVQREVPVVARATNVPERAWSRVRALLGQGSTVAMRMWGDFDIRDGVVLEIEPNSVCIIEEEGEGGRQYRFELRDEARGREKLYFIDGDQQELTQDAEARWRRLLSLFARAQLSKGQLRMGSNGIPIEALVGEATSPTIPETVQSPYPPKHGSRLR